MKKSHIITILNYALISLNSPVTKVKIKEDVGFEVFVDFTCEDGFKDRVSLQQVITVAIIILRRRGVEIDSQVNIFDKVALIAKEIKIITVKNKELILIYARNSPLLAAGMDRAKHSLLTKIPSPDIISL